MEHICRVTAQRTKIHWAMVIISTLLIQGQLSRVYCQTEIDTQATTISGETALFWVQIPAGYNEHYPPALLIWWHQFGGSQHEMRDYSDFETVANARGWIAASHMGPSDRHWNARSAQEHCRAMLDWLTDNYPFSRDSIYMIGGSMGGAAGQVWHNNNCGSNDYLIAANAGSSPILDCQLRQEQYLASGDTNRSMRLMFGGLPLERDSVAFEYHRYSAIHFADTSQSMHFNSLNLPVWLTWGNRDDERFAYGGPAAIWDSLRQADNADTSVIIPSEIAGHGVAIMNTEEVCDWLSGFSVNRYPDRLSINADESGDYYWTYVDLLVNDTTFGRYGVVKNPDDRRLDVTLVRNISQLEINFDFPWSDFDSLVCSWQQLDTAISGLQVVLNSVPEPDSIIVAETGRVHYEYEPDPELLRIDTEPYDVIEFVVYFRTESVSPHNPILATDTRLMQAYPNPFNSTVNLLIESHITGNRNVIFYDVLGREAGVFRAALRPGTQRLAIAAAGLCSGIYFINVEGSPTPPLKVMLLR